MYSFIHKHSHKDRKIKTKYYAHELLPTLQQTRTIKLATAVLKKNNTDGLFSVQNPKKSLEQCALRLVKTL